jgi:tetratricopeptide (TPR) repeat protein
MNKEALRHRYFSNSLTEDERKQFHKLLETDAGFKEQFEFEQNLKRVIRDKENKNLKGKLIDFERRIEKSSTPSKSKGNIRKWSIAASVAFLMALGWYGYNALSGTDYEHLYASNFEAYPNTVYSITRSDSDGSLERDAFAAYESKEYEKAILNFEKVPEEDGKEYLDFYKAQSYLALGDNAQAIKLFREIEMENASFGAEASWYLALVYLKKKDKAKAIQGLQQHVEKYDYNKERAITLLEELR